MKHLPGHVRRFVARQKDVARGDFARLAGPFHRGVGAECGDLLAFERRRDERRPNRAWGDAIDANALADERFGERAGEGDDCAFCRRVVDELFVSFVGGDRSGVDNGASVL